MTEQQERRQQKRFDMALEVEVRIGERAGQGKILNLSLGGCLLSTPFTVPPGKEVHLTFRSADQTPLHVRGEVRSLIEGRGLGIKFLDLTQTSREQIRRTVYSRLVEQKRAFDLSPKRKEPRVKLAIPVRVRGHNVFEEPFEETTVTENISPGGACVSLRQFLAIGTIIQMEAYGQFRANAVVTVRWTKDKDGELFLVGVQFLETEGEWLLK